MKMLILPFAALIVNCATTDPYQIAEAAPLGGKRVSGEEGQAINHYLSSLLYEKTGQYEKAVRALREAADLIPGSISLQVKLLVAYYQNRDYENAVTMAERAIHKEPENVVWHIWLGRTYFQLERLDEAIGAFETAISLNPGSALGYEALVEIEERTNDLVGATGVYEKLIEMRPDSAFLHYRLGFNLAKMDDNEGAKAQLKRAVELNPKMTAALYLLAVIALETDETAQAIDYLNQMLKETPDNIDARVNLAAANARLHDYDTAIESLSEVTENSQLNPRQFTRYYIERMYLYLRQGTLEDPSLAVAPSGAPFLGTLLQALIRKQAGEPHRGLIDSLDGIEGDLDGECTAYLNDILAMFGSKDAGMFIEQQLRDLKKEGRRSKSIEVVLGRLLMSMDRDEEARTVLLAVLDEFGPDKWLHYYLGTVSENLKRHVETEKHLRACLSIDPNDPDIMNFLGYLFAEENKNLDEAEELLERALRIDPENGYYLDSLGWILYRKGDARKAVEHIKRAIRLMPSDDAVLRDHLGDAYQLDGQREQAIAEWKRSIRLDPSQETVQKKIERNLRKLSE